MRSRVPVLAVFAVLALAFPLHAAAQGWPMYGGSASHGFDSATVPPPRLGVLWSVRTNVDLGRVVPVAADGSLYLGDLDRLVPPDGPNVVLHKVAADGSQFPTQGTWRTRVVIANVTDLPAAPRAFAVGPPRSPAVSGGLVYALFTVHNGTHAQEVLLGLDAATGNLNDAVARGLRFGGALWNATAPNATRSAPVVSQNLVFFGSQDGRVYALNAADLSLAWSYDTGEPVHGVPAVSGNVVYATAGSRLLYLDLRGCADDDKGVVDAACTPANATRGDLILEIDAGAVIRASPVVGPSLVYLDVAGDIWAFDRTFGGAPVWKRETAHETAATPALSGTTLVARRTDGRVYAYGAASGQPLWVRAGLVAPADAGDMAIADGRVFLSAADGASLDLVTLDLADGDVLGRHLGPSRPSLGAPVAAEGLVLVTEGDRLLALRGQVDLEVLPGDIVLSVGQARGGVARGNVSVTVRNVGDEDARNVRVRVFSGDAATGTLLGDTTIATAKPLAEGGRAVVYTEDRDWPVGRHEVTVVVDPAPGESDTDANAASVVVYVQAGPPPEPTVVPPEAPLALALLAGFLVGVLVLWVPIRRVRRLHETEPEGETDRESL